MLLQVVLATPIEMFRFRSARAFERRSPEPNGAFTFTFGTPSRTERPVQNGVRTPNAEAPFTWLISSISGFIYHIWIIR